MGFEPGMTINGRYELGRQLGAGGMARVFLAHDRLLDREVAVKVLFDRYAADPSFVERFRREASAAAGLNHPNIVAVYDRGEADDSYYIVMEYLAGPDLKEVIRRRAPLPPGEAVDYALQILAALGAAHRRDVVHRDVKPQNVMVAEDGHLKVTDFGIARAGAQTEMTEVGSVIGTAQYLSPEQARGDDVTAASDCYAVGIVLYEMLTGRVPFDGDRPMTVAMKQVNEPPVPPRIYEPAVPIELDAVVVKALAKRPGDRYRTAEEFRGALLDLRGELEGGTAMTRAFAAAPATAATRVMPPSAPPPPPPPRTARTRVAPIPPEEAPRRRRSRALPILLWLLALVVIGGVAAAYLLSGGDKVPVPSVQGLTLADAQDRIDQAGLVGEPVGVEAEAEEGTVVSTDPSAGTEVDEGSTVVLRVSSGPGTVPVPDVTGERVGRARQRLEDAGFTVADAGRGGQRRGGGHRDPPGPGRQHPGRGRRHGDPDGLDRAGGGDRARRHRRLGRRRARRARGGRPDRRRGRRRGEPRRPRGPGHPPEPVRRRGGRVGHRRDPDRRGGRPRGDHGAVGDRAVGRRRPGHARRRPGSSWSARAPTATCPRTP